MALILCTKLQPNFHTWSSNLELPRLQLGLDPSNLIITHRACFKIPFNGDAIADQSSVIREFCEEYYEYFIIRVELY